MSATPRSFTVFLDAPPADPVKPRGPDVSQSHSHNTLSVSDLLSPSLASGTAAKENLHPITGESTASSKKRKTSSVLATKVHNPPTSKKQKESSGLVVKPKSETKKRKSSTSASASSPLKAKAKGATSDKESKRVVLSGVVKKKSSNSSSRVSKRKVSPLPKLEEEAGDDSLERLAQAGVDSKCYELTVLPLADVTQAYDDSTSMEYLPLGEEPAKGVLSRSLRAKSSEPDLRDYYTPSSSIPSLSHSQSSCTSKRASSMPPASSIEDDAKAFSTPERKQIYAAFTFTSPSPTSARYGLTRSSSVDAIQFCKDA